MFLKNLLLAYQLEGYYHRRYLKFIYSHPKFWIAGSRRQVLDWTAKAKLIFLITTSLCVISFASIVYFALGNTLLYIFLPIIFLLLPCYYVIANLLLYPLDSYLKKQIIKNAKNKISKFQNLTVIAITGSMGKTTTKEILRTTLGESFNVIATQGTKNTPLGISRLILDELNETHEIFIVEMGAYVKGNIKELCNIVGPDISIITGITLQHLERFKDLDSIIDAKFEILEALGEDDFAIVDATTLGVQRGLKEKTLAVQNIKEISGIIPYSYKENLSGIIFDFEGKKIETKLLSNYLGNTFRICYEVGKHLGQIMQDFQSGVTKVDFIEHRMQLIYNPQSNIYILDDSFNGNIEGIGAIVDMMEKAPFSGRKILACGGVVELGDKTEQVHKDIAKNISPVSDMILLVEGPVGNALEKGLIENNYPEENIKKYPSALALHEDIGNIIQSGDLIVFQNDLPDHYL